MTRRSPAVPSPEYSLLLDAIAPATVPRADIATWDARRWHDVVRVAEWHRLVPMLARHCATLEGVPADVRAQLDAGYLANAARNLYVDQALQRVLGTLRDAAVPAMPLKGAALVETAYPDRALREMLDLDLLVPADRLDDAGAALTLIGYGPLPDEAGGIRAPAPARADHHHDPALVTDERIVAVELHHHVAMRHERAHFDIGGLWDRARPAPRWPDHVLPSPEDLLLHVCLHFTRNRLGGSYRRDRTGGALSQLGDVAQLVAHEELDWAALTAHARAYRLTAPVFLALFAARAVGVTVCDDALADLQPAGFDAGLGRQLVQLRVLRTGRHLPVRSLRFIVAPGREVLERGWHADPRTRRSLARAYARRAMAQAPLVRAALLRPRLVVRDYRLNGRIGALERREQAGVTRRTARVTKA